MRRLFAALIVILIVVTACRKEDYIVPSTRRQVTHPDPEVGEIKGFFLLNEGNMGSNKASIDYFDYTTGCYTKNIYAERNPTVIKELGDVGNDIAIYDGRLYCVINCSNLVEVMDATTAKHIGYVSIPNCRYIAFEGGYAYVSSYAGAVMSDPHFRKGYIAKVDLDKLEVVAQCDVGYQPDGLVVVDNKLYVANSGGYTPPNYDRRVSVIELDTFTETKTIDVAINLHQILLDRYGYLWVSSRGDYYDVPSKTYIIDSQTDKVIKELDLPNSNMTRSGDSIYLYSSEQNFAIINTQTQSVVDTQFIKDKTQTNITKPYGLAVNPSTREVFITDAKDYTTPGKIHCYSYDGVLKWSETTGDIPAHIVFTTERLQDI